MLLKRLNGDSEATVDCKRN